MGQKAATAKGMMVAEYRDKILFPHGIEHVIAKVEQFLKLNPEAKGNPINQRTSKKTCRRIT